MTESHERRFAYVSQGLPTLVYALMLVLILGLLAAAGFSEGALRYGLLVPVLLLTVLLWSGHRVASLDQHGARAVLLGPDTLKVPRPMSREGVHEIPLDAITAVEDEGGRLVIRANGRAVTIPANMLEPTSYEVLRRELQRRIGAGS